VTQNFDTCPSVHEQRPIKLACIGRGLLSDDLTRMRDGKWLLLPRLRRPHSLGEHHRAFQPGEQDLDVVALRPRQNQTVLVIVAAVGVDTVTCRYQGRLPNRAKVALRGWE